MIFLKFFVGIAGVMAIFVAVAAIAVFFLDWCGFFNWKTFECAKCGHFFHDQRWLARLDGKTYCLTCYKPGHGHDRSHFFGRCADCQKEFPLAAMIGMNRDLTCEPCWRKRLWPKDWRKKFKEMRESSHSE